MVDLGTVLLCIVLPVFGTAWMAIVFYHMTKGNYKRSVRPASKYSQGGYMDEPDYIIDDEPYHHHR